MCVCESLQQIKSLLKHAEQKLLEVRGDAVFAHQLINAVHGHDAQTGTIHLTAPAEAPVPIGWETPGAGVSIRSGQGFHFDWLLASEASEMKDGCQEGWSDGGGKRNPAEKMRQTFQR